MKWIIICCVGIESNRFDVRKRLRGVRVIYFGDFCMKVSLVTFSIAKIPNSHEINWEFPPHASLSMDIRWKARKRRIRYWWMFRELGPSALALSRAFPSSSSDSTRECIFSGVFHLLGRHFSSPVGHPPLADVTKINFPRSFLRQSDTQNKEITRGDGWTFLFALCTYIHCVFFLKLLHGSTAFLSRTTGTVNWIFGTLGHNCKNNQGNYHTEEEISWRKSTWNPNNTVFNLNTVITNILNIIYYI